MFDYKGNHPPPRAKPLASPRSNPQSDFLSVNDITEVHSMKWTLTVLISIAIFSAAVIAVIYINAAKTDRPRQDDAMVKEVRDKALQTIREARARMEEEPVTPSVPEGFTLQEFPEEHFRIAFPGIPTVKKYALAVEYLVVTTEEIGYSVLVNELPRRFVGKAAEAFLSGELESKISVLKEGAGAELTESAKCVVDDNPALSYQYQLEVDGVRIVRKGTNVLVGDRMYGISVFGRQDASSRSDYDKFVNSFKYVTD